MPLSTRERNKFGTSVNAELLEHFKREADYRKMSKARLMDEIFMDRYRDKEKRFPIRIHQPKDQNDKWAMIDFSNCEY